MSGQWLQLPERGTTFALRLITWIGLHIGSWAGRLLLFPITAYFLVTISPTIRRASRDYLTRVLDQPIRWWHVGKHFHCYATMILDRVFFLANRFDHIGLRVHNGQMVLDQVASGKGCLLLASHLGSFEVMRAVGVTERGIPVKALMNVDHNQKMTRFLASLNPAMAQTIIPSGGFDALLKVKESLDQGYLVGMLGDRNFGSDKTTECRFLGQQASFPAGPMILASTLDCPVILAFGLLRGGNRYDVHFEFFAERVTINRGARQADIQHWTQRYADRLEHYTRSAPYNWFNFYDYWAA